jgi:hypothetical protein
MLTWHPGSPVVPRLFFGAFTPSHSLSFLGCGQELLGSGLGRLAVTADQLQAGANGRRSAMSDQLVGLGLFGQIEQDLACLPDIRLDVIRSRQLAVELELALVEVFVNVNAKIPHLAGTHLQGGTTPEELLSLVLGLLELLVQRFTNLVGDLQLAEEPIQICCCHTSPLYPRLNLSVHLSISEPTGR